MEFGNENGALAKRVWKALIDRLKTASADEVTSAYRNDTAWIRDANLAAGNVSRDSFVFLGPKVEGGWRNLPGDWTLVIDFDGMADCGVVETEFGANASDEEIEDQLGGLPLLTVDEARVELIEVAMTSLVDEFEGRLSGL